MPKIKFELPDQLGEKAAQFRESSYGVTLVTLVLKNGTQIPHVHVAGGSVVKASGAPEEALLADLSPSEIVDVVPEV